MRILQNFGFIHWYVQSFGFASRNPVLKNITEYLVEEGSYEEEALLGSLTFDRFFSSDL